MKIQHYAIVFIIIVLPFSIVCRSLMNEKIDALNDETRINNAIDTATTDAIDTLITLNEEFYNLYEGETVDITPPLAQEGLDTFFRTMAINFNLPFTENNKLSEEYFSAYVPAVIVIAFDGFYVYSIEYNDVTDEYEYVLSPKIPYAYEENEYIINFTLGNSISIYAPNGVFYEGELKNNYIDEPDICTEYAEYRSIFGSKSSTLSYLSQLSDNMSLIIYALEQSGFTGIPSFLTTKIAPSAIPMLNDYTIDGNYDIVSDFHKKRREIIINLIRETLNEKMNNHNRYADMMGITYNFYLPEIDDDDWMNSVDDVSIMSFIQGIPIGQKSYYNSYALGASRIIRSDFTYGTINASHKIYHKWNCPDLVGLIDSEGYPISGIEELFVNIIDAAKAGYYPCIKCKP